MDKVVIDFGTLDPTSLSIVFLIFEHRLVEANLVPANFWSPLKVHELILKDTIHMGMEFSVTKLRLLLSLENAV